MAASDPWLRTFGGRPALTLAAPARKVPVELPGWGPADYEPHELALVAELEAGGADTWTREVELLHAMKVVLDARVLTDDEVRAENDVAPGPGDGAGVAGAVPAEPEHLQGRLL